MERKSYVTSDYTKHALAAALKELITHFYVVALAGLTESWLLGRVDRTPQELIAFADQLLQDHVRGAKMHLEGKTEQ